MSLLSLPLEILQEIVECIGAVHRPSLISFGLTSRACHKASTIVLFRHLTITISSREDLQHQVETLLPILSRTNAARHVHHVSIKGYFHFKPKFRKRDSEATYYGWRRENWLVKESLVDILPDESPEYCHNSYVVYDQAVTKPDSMEDTAWTPIVALFQQTLCVRDLVFDSATPFPPCLLDVLHKSLPRCRLHHRTFKLRTLLWGVPHALEMALATSPNLHSLRIACARRDSDGDDDFNLEAIMELATMAPNIKHVSIINLQPYDTRQFDRRRRGEWQGLPGYNTGARGSLKSLEVRGMGILVTHLRDWARYTDFACLEELRVGGSYQNEDYALSGDDLQWLATDHEFPRLKSLSINLTRDDRQVERPRYSAQVETFFVLLPSLVELTVIGPLDANIMKVILTTHGNTLQHLSLYPFEETWNYQPGRIRVDIPMQFSHADLTAIQTQCPHLQHLALPIKRNQSRASEVALYKCFSLMHNLRTLFLTLDCAEWRIGRDASFKPRFSGADDEIINRPAGDDIRRGTLKEMIINCAVDEELARSIWGVINAEKKGVPMEWVKLWTTNEGMFGGSEYYSQTLRELSRSWIIERCVQDGDKITSRRLGRRDGNNFLSTRPEGEIFKELWKFEKDREDWEDVWRSFPLEVGE